MWRKPRSDHDEDWEGDKGISTTWPRKFLDRCVLYEVAKFVSKYADCEMIDDDNLKILGKAGRNVCVRAIPDIGSDAVIRFSRPDVDAFPEERLRNEVAVMRYIHDETSIPVPFIFHWGTQEKSLDALGPVMVMEYMDHDRTMSDILRNPRFPDHFPPILDNNVYIEVLERMYGHLADIILQLYMKSFLCVGSLDHVDDFTWEATKRPLSLQINDMALTSNLPESHLPSTIFYTASSYMEALADLHMHNLIHQKHRVTSANRFRQKFIARKLFQRLAQEKKLTDVTLEDARHTLCCDSLHPTKVLLDGVDLAAVLGWEYTYTAPLEFSHAPPWWLLLEKPELWPSGLEDWQTQFDCRLQDFLRMLIECENRRQLPDDQRLSGLMKRNWEKGDFWVLYAARSSTAFDEIYWRKIDEKFFGTTDDPDSWEERLLILSEEEKEEMEALVSANFKETE